MKKIIIDVILVFTIIILNGCSKDKTFNDVSSMETKIAKELDKK